MPGASWRSKPTSPRSAAEDRHGRRRLRKGAAGGRGPIRGPFLLIRIKRTQVRHRPVVASQAALKLAGRWDFIESMNFNGSNPDPWPWIKMRAGGNSFAA
jgi:hypothetical protein